MEPISVKFDELFVTPDGYLLNAESKFGRYAGLTSNEAEAGYFAGGAAGRKPLKRRCSMGRS